MLRRIFFMGLLICVSVVMACFSQSANSQASLTPLQKILDRLRIEGREQVLAPEATKRIGLTPHGETLTVRQMLAQEDSGIKHAFSRSLKNGDDLILVRIDKDQIYAFRTDINMKFIAGYRKVPGVGPVFYGAAEGQKEVNAEFALWKDYVE